MARAFTHSRLHAITRLILRPFALPIATQLSLSFSLSLSLAFSPSLHLSLIQAWFPRGRHKGRGTRAPSCFTLHDEDDAPEGHASSQIRGQEAIKSRNVFTWRRHVDRGVSATTAVSSNGSFRPSQPAPTNGKGINRDDCFTDSLDNDGPVLFWVALVLLMEPFNFDGLRTTITNFELPVSPN